MEERAVGSRDDEFICRRGVGCTLGYPNDPGL